MTDSSSIERRIDPRLKRLGLSNYRCFSTLEPLDLGRLNIFIGANHSGKSTILSAIELILRAVGHGARPTPLAIEGSPALASFSSVLRKQWTPTAPKPTEFSISASWEVGSDGEELSCRYRFKGNEQDDSSYVSSAEYGGIGMSENDKPVIEVVAANRARRYKIKEWEFGERPGFRFVEFVDGFPFVFAEPGEHADLKTRFLSAVAQKVVLRSRRRWRADRLHIIEPHRPIPRSFYVLDDPGLDSADRALLSFLLSTWRKEEVDSEQVQSTIIKDLRTLRLAKYLEVGQPLKLSRPVIRLQVSTGTKREFVSIADVGFGLSQVLPLVARNASLKGGCLIAYQPEVHLHPFAQSRLADLFVDSLARGNVVFVETHSEYIILRLQYLIAAGRISAADVRVFCVESKGSASTVYRMLFDEKGRPDKKWPRGFLDTAIDLAGEVAAQRLSGEVPG